MDWLPKAGGAVERRTAIQPSTVTWSQDDAFCPARHRATGEVSASCHHRSGLRRGLSFGLGEQREHVVSQAHPVARGALCKLAMEPRGNLKHDLAGLGCGVRRQGDVVAPSILVLDPALP